MHPTCAYQAGEPEETITNNGLLRALLTKHLGA
jgi:hypothetical protein